MHIDHGSTHPGNCRLVTTTWERCNGCSFTRNHNTQTSLMWCNDANVQPQDIDVGLSEVLNRFRF